LSESPSRAATRSAGGFSSRITATSVSASVPTVFAVNSRPSVNVTLTRVAPDTTCRLVTMLPRASMITPEPVPRCGPGDGSGMPGPNWKKRRKNGAISSSPSSRSATRGCSISTSMRTTDGRRAFAAAENADDNTRASLGASVFGVTVPPGASEGAGGPDVGASAALPWSALGGGAA
jgi:hypothetical protein